MADSTLRHADITGLSADIICMSGGRVGQIAHMVKDAPHIQTTKNLVVVAGANDITQERETMDEFEKKVTKGVVQIIDQAHHVSLPVTWVAPPPRTDLSFLGNQKRDRFPLLLEELSQRKDRKFTLLVASMAPQMANGHMTADGTKTYLQEIHNSMPIITNAAHITTTRIYSGVETAYPYGCLLCLEHLRLNVYGLCPNCRSEDDPVPPITYPTSLTDQGGSC